MSRFDRFCYIFAAGWVALYLVCFAAAVVLHIVGVLK